MYIYISILKIAGPCTSNPLICFHSYLYLSANDENLVKSGRVTMCHSFCDTDGCNSAICNSTLGVINALGILGMILYNWCPVILQR